MANRGGRLNDRALWPSQTKYVDMRYVDVRDRIALSVEYVKRIEPNCLLAFKNNFIEKNNDTIFNDIIISKQLLLYTEYTFTPRSI